ncbi:RraA family protein [Marinobacter sp. chi1]|uniref:Putative 4-hydroxy-4-methyl-2-oxoglutarate aldolase n=1 Tax=Marinobacter suaedae TaxID=3057675 RepID=A0ABT8W1L0_9GAMM|nr:RraA family protein [Marinobacter sp. chi1]MDO3722066.1 RraA family protein [Marinobacter sp. chi1]
MTEKPASAAMHLGPGFRIREYPSRPRPDISQKLGEFETADISDQLNRLYTLSHDIHNLVNDLGFAGPAITIKVFPGDNLMLHKALDLIQPGDVLVIDAGGSDSNAVIGDLIASKAKHRGAAGVVVDGLVRDIKGLKEVGLPVFGKGISPIGPLQRGPGEVNYAISCGGIVVNPGDIVVADMAGVVIVRQEFAGDLLAHLEHSREQRAEYEASVRRGEFNNEWVDQVLDSSNCLRE